MKWIKSFWRWLTGQKEYTCIIDSNDMFVMDVTAKTPKEAATIYFDRLAAWGGGTHVVDVFDFDIGSGKWVFMFYPNRKSPAE